MQTMKKINIVRPDEISFTEKNIFSDENGRDLFFLMIMPDNNGLGGYWVKSSTSFHKEWNRYELWDINEVVSASTDDILKIPNIENKFLHESFLDKYGKLCQERYDLEEERWSDGLVVDEPVTSTYNADKFSMFISENIVEKMDGTDNEISREEFEKYLTTDLLREEYVAHYHPDCKFYSSIGNHNDEVKTVLKNNYLVMFFRNK